MSKYSKDCRICRTEQEAEIQNLQKQIDLFNQNSNEQDEENQKLHEELRDSVDKIKELKLTAKMAHDTAQSEMDRNHRLVEDKRALIKQVEAAKTCVNSLESAEYYELKDFIKEIRRVLGGKL